MRSMEHQPLHLSSTNPKFPLIIDHPHNHNPKNIHNYVEKEKKKQKVDERRGGMIMLGWILIVPKLMSHLDDIEDVPGASTDPS